jgi:hypothetical protein
MRRDASKNSPLFEIARLLVRFEKQGKQSLNENLLHLEIGCAFSVTRRGVTS